MKIQTFGIKEAVKTGWDLFKANWKFLIVLGLLILFVEGVNVFISEIPYIGIILSMIITGVWTLGSMKIFLDIYDKKEVRYTNLFNQWHKLVPYFGIMIISTVIMLGGLLLLIVPGIIASIALSFSLYLMVDKDMKIIESIKTSWAITQGYRWEIFILGIVLIGINILGILALMFGLLVSIPVSFFVMIHVYRTLLKNAEEGNMLPVERLQTAPKVFMILGPLVLVGIFVASTIMLSEINITQQQARDVARMADVKQLQLAAEIYYEANQIYPDTLDVMKNEEYLLEVPMDPADHKVYEYTVLEDGRGYKICVDFETKEDACFTQDN